MTPAFVIRLYTEDDYAAVATVYRSAVEAQAPAGYSQAQIRLWASYPKGGDEFRSRLALGATLVCEVDGSVVAFGQLEPTHHVAFLYCHPDYTRRGLATAIYAKLEAQARAAGVQRITTEASHIGREFFLRQGFVLVQAEKQKRLGVEFESFKLEKAL